MPEARDLGRPGPEVKVLIHTLLTRFNAKKKMKMMMGVGACFAKLRMFVDETN